MDNCFNFAFSIQTIKMKITIKRHVNASSSRVGGDEFRQKARVVLNTVVKPQIQIAKTKKMDLNSAQKAHKNCNGPI